MPIWQLKVFTTEENQISGENGSAMGSIAARSVPPLRSAKGSPVPPSSGAARQHRKDSAQQRWTVEPVTCLAEVNDAQTPMGKADRTVVENPRIIWSSMRKDCIHPL